MLAYGGKPDASRRMLEDILEAHPECDEARALLSDYREAAGAASRKAASARAESSEASEINR
jgi:hypothetical protein